MACALIAQPGCSLTFQVHPQAQGQGVEAEILAWGLAQTQLIAQARGTSHDLWCRCHEVEQELRSVLEAAGFLPLFERDLRLVHALLLTGLRQMQARGATGAYLETSESNVPAQRLFASVGFTHLSSWQWYAKTVEPR